MSVNISLLAMELCSKSTVPCAACKLLRRRCTKNCIYLPFFPPSEPEKFAVVHRVFGASNINKMLQEIPMNDRGDAVTSLVYEARARLQEPVYGCVAFISSLQNQLIQLRSELDEVTAQTVALKTQLSTALSMHVTSQSPLLTYDNSPVSDMMSFNPLVTDSSYKEAEDMYTYCMFDFPSL